VLLFVVGLPKEANEAIDFGRPRKTADVVRSKGYKNPYIVSATASTLLRVKSDSFARRDAPGTHEEVLEMLRRHPNAEHSAHLAKQQAKAPVPGALIAAVHYIGGTLMRREKHADVFIAAWMNYTKNKKKGIQARENNALWLWMDHLDEMAQRGLEIKRGYRAYGTIMIWNLFLEGKVPENISVPERCSFKYLDYTLL